MQRKCSYAKVNEKHVSQQLYSYIIKLTFFWSLQYLESSGKDVFIWRILNKIHIFGFKLIINKNIYTNFDKINLRNSFQSRLTI